MNWPKALTWLAWAIIGFSILIGIGTRLVSVFTYTQFQNDQARDAQVYQDFWDEDLSWGDRFIAYGPSASVKSDSHEFKLPPLYYYLVLPVTFFTDDPVWQAVPNATFSFFSIPLFGLLIWQLFKQTSKPARWLLTAVGMLWWSLYFNDILLSNMEWNPSPAPFFTILFLLLWSWLMKPIDPKVMTKNLWSFSRIRVLAWISYGLLTAILISLHSSLLFVLPIFFLGSLVWWWRKNKNWRLPSLACLAFIVALAPYWYGELSSGLENTRAMWNVVFGSSNQWHSPLWMINRMFQNYIELGQMNFFVEGRYEELGYIFMGAGLVLGTLWFQGNRKLWYSILILFGLHSLSVIFVPDPIFVHYKILIWWLPIVFTLSVFNRLIDKLKTWENTHDSYLYLVSSILFLTASAGALEANAIYIQRVHEVKYGPEKTLNTETMIDALSEVPPNENVCVPASQTEAYAYLDEHIVKNNLHIVPFAPDGTCSVDLLIRPRYIPDGNQKLIAPPKPSSHEGDKICSYRTLETKATYSLQSKNCLVPTM